MRMPSCLESIYRCSEGPSPLIRIHHVSHFRSDTNTCSKMSSHAMEHDHDFKNQDILHSEVVGNKEMMATAFDGENREHEMGMMEAIKSYPMACMWAFIFCFTIVSTPKSEESLPEVV